MGDEWGHAPNFHPGHQRCIALETKHHCAFTKSRRFSSLNLELVRHPETWCVGHGGLRGAGRPGEPMGRRGRLSVSVNSSKGYKGLLDKEEGQRDKMLVFEDLR